MVPPKTVPRCGTVILAEAARKLTEALPSIKTRSNSSTKKATRQKPQVGTDKWIW